MPDRLSHRCMITKTGLIELDNPWLPICKMWVSGCASPSPAADVRAQSTRRHLEGALNQGKPMGVGDAWLYGKCNLPGSTTLLVSNLLYSRAVPTKPPEGPTPCLVDPASATLNCLCAWVSWAMHNLPIARSVGPGWGRGHSQVST